MWDIFMIFCDSGRKKLLVIVCHALPVTGDPWGTNDTALQT